MGFFKDLKETVTGVFTDTISAVGSAFGIEELDINQQIEDAENEARQKIKEERERLHAQLNSANAKERISAKKKLAAMEEDNKNQIGKMQRDYLEANRKMDAELKAKKESLDTQEKPKGVEFDREKMLRLRRKAIATPTIGPRPGQGTVIPRPTAPPVPRSGQGGNTRPR